MHSLPESNRGKGSFENTVEPSDLGPVVTLEGGRTTMTFGQIFCSHLLLVSLNVILPTLLIVDAQRSHAEEVLSS